MWASGEEGGLTVEESGPKGAQCGPAEGNQCGPETTRKAGPWTEHGGPLQLAMRSIVGNVVYNIAKGTAINPETMNRFITEADASKSKRAQELLRKLRERPLLQSNRGES